MVGALTIRRIDDEVKSRLRQRAAEHNHSMEEEARLILRRELIGTAGHGKGLATEIRHLVEAAGGGVDLELPPRGPARPLPDIFDE
jgi:plasmid stability protein